MYDVNPLGPLMHLKELERQAKSAARSDTNKIRMLGEELMARLRRIVSDRNSVVRQEKA